MLGIYARKSTDKQKSIELQIALGESFAKDKGWDYIIYSDEGLSGTGDISNRPQFEKMLGDIVSGKITKVHIWSQNRAEREPLTFFTLAKIVQDHNTKLYENGVEIDLNNEDTFFMRGIQSMLNRMEVKKRNVMITDKLRYNAEQGKVHSRPPLGYTKSETNHIIIDEDDAKLVRRIFQLSEEGKGGKVIARMFTLEGIPTMRGAKQWSSNTILDIIKNPWYKGERNFSGNIYEVPVIIPKDKWERAQKNLKKNRRYSGKITRHNYLLNKGLIKCARCGKSFQGKRNANYGYAYYRCASEAKPHKCGNSGIRIEYIEEAIWIHFFSNNKLLNKVKKLNNNTDNSAKQKELEIELEKLKAEVSKQNSKRKNAARLAFDQILSDDEVKEELKSIDSAKLKLNNSIINIEEQLNYLKKLEQKEKIDNSSLENLYKNLPFKKKKEIVKKIINHISINKENGYFTIEIKYNMFPLPNERFIVDELYNETILVDIEADNKARAKGYDNILGWEKDVLKNDGKIPKELEYAITVLLDVHPPGKK